MDAIQLSNKLILSTLSKPISAKKPRLSAIKTFLEKPIRINIRPIEILLRLIFLFFLRVYCGTI